MSTIDEKRMSTLQYVTAKGIVDIEPAVITHLGKVNMLDSKANLIEDVDGDWCIQGNIWQLTDKEFNQIWNAVRRDAMKVFEYSAND